MSQELQGSTFDLLQIAGGVVLDVGPGTREILHWLNLELIKKAYGVEPAVDIHQAL
jgi:hypothetical protein